MIINIPIESLEERYSAQWNVWFPTEFGIRNIDFRTIYAETLTTTIKQGSFLDVHSTNYFKAGQLKEIIYLIYNKKIKDEDILFFHDLWFPGLEMLQYIRQASNMDFKICGILHAGTYDQFDFLSRMGMDSWGKNLEECWFDFINYIFVATNFHKDLILKNRKIDETKIKVTGLPIYDCSSVGCFDSHKEDIIVFPHRLDEEKNPKYFETLEKRLAYTGWKFIYSKEVANSRREYLNLLKKSKIAVSFADQETWGIAMQECVFSGCLPVVPARLSYEEMYDSKFKYDSMGQCISIILDMMSNRWKYYSTFEKNRKELLFDGSRAIEKMISYMEGL